MTFGLRTLSFCVVLGLVFVSCSKGAMNDALPSDEEERIHLNICVLGNSYSNDSFSYVPFILLQYGITCKIQVYYKGSGSIRDLAEQWQNDGQYDLAELDGKKHNRFHFSIDTRTQKAWKTERIMSASDIIRLDKWDIVTVQQVSSLAKNEATYSPYLQTVLDLIDSACQYPHNKAWFVAYNRAKDNANKETLDTQERIIHNYPFDMVIPVATAVFSCQENETLSKLGDSRYHRLYAADNVHLQEGLPCYVAALTVAQSILNAMGIEKSVEGNTIRPTQEWINSINGITQNGESIGVTEENCALAQKAAVQANLHPFEIIPVQ